MHTTRTLSSTPLTYRFAQLRRSMRRVPPFTGRASIGSVRFQPSSSLGVRLGENHLQDDTGAHKSTGRDPPWHLPLQSASRRSRRLSFVRTDSAFATDGSVSICPRGRRHRPFRVLSRAQSSRQRRRKTDTSVKPRRVCDVIRTAIGILANHARMALRKSSYVFFVGCVHICPQARQLNHWIVPTGSPTSRCLLPQLLQNCCGGGRRAGCGAEVFSESIRRTDYAGNCRLSDVLFWTVGAPLGRRAVQTASMAQEATSRNP